MTDSALRDNDPSAMTNWLMRGRPDFGLAPVKTGDPVLAWKGPPRGATQGETPGPNGERDWSSALDLIHEATAAIRISEERSIDLEQELERVMAQSHERSRLLEAQAAAAERRTEKAEERVRLAEKRANEAEAWLARLHDAVIAGFSRPAVARPADDAHEEPPAAPGAETSAP